MDIKLETQGRVLIGWSRVKALEPPAVLYMGQRVFRYRGEFRRGPAAHAGDPMDLWLYSVEIPYVLTEPVTPERPA